MAKIKLSNCDQRALVDDADLPFVEKYTWRAMRKKSGATYAVTDVRTGSKTIKLLMHRLILSDVRRIDHRNRNGLDNRRANLRPATDSQNQSNRPGESGTSRYKGVSWDRRRKKWRAQIAVNGRSFSIGRFNSEHEAAKAYNEKALELHGEFAYCNEVRG